MDDQYLQLIYVGHSTIFIDMDGTQLLTDPFLRRWIWHLRRKKIPIDDRVVGEIDAILISHAHWDHLDLKSLQIFRRDVLLVVPRGLGKFLQKKGFVNVSEVTESEELPVGSLTVQVTRAKHDGSRFPFGPSTEPVGYRINGSRTIYFPGDTDLFPEMTAIGEGLDIALMPVWGWGPTLGSGHLDPAGAARAVELLKPQLAIPIHWGTLYPIGLNILMPNFLVNPPLQFRSEVNQLTPTVKVIILDPGEIYRGDY